MVIPREGVERYVLMLMLVFCADIVIPREGVESEKMIIDALASDAVIPREGVESFSNIHHLTHVLDSIVIPREGVERYINIRSKIPIWIIQ